MNCISLGWYCGTASSMGVYGLRGRSGPFDWYYSDLDSVIKLIRNGFSDFFARENLVPHPDRKRVFLDRKYGFVCFHDIKTDLDYDYPSIHTKYSRRARYFLEAIKEPTCFFRAVRSKQEMSYIQANHELIISSLKEHNANNEIIYLIPDGVGTFSRDELPCFLLNRDYGYDGVSLMTMFDNNSDLLDFCSVVLPFETLENNRKYYNASNVRCTTEALKVILEDGESVFRRIMAGLKAESNEGIYLWGGGYQGTHLYDYLTKKQVEVLGIVDIHFEKRSGTKLPIICPDVLPEGSKVFISIASDKDNEEVKEELKRRKCMFLTYKDIMNDEYGE